MRNKKKKKTYIRGVLFPAVYTDISSIFINCVDARRHVTNRFTKCVIAFGFNARPRERHHTRHPANRILLAHSRMNEHKGGGGEARGRGWWRVTVRRLRRWYGTPALLFEIHVDNRKTTSVIVINVIDPDLLSRATSLHRPPRPSSSTPTSPPFVDRSIALCRRCALSIRV